MSGHEKRSSISERQSGLVFDRNSRKSMGSLLSSENHHGMIEHHHEDVLDALGLIADDTSSISNINSHGDSSAFIDHRKMSEIHPDQKMMRPKKHFKEDVFTQRSKLLSHNRDRFGNGQQITETEYGAIGANISTLNNTQKPGFSNSNQLPYLSDNPFATQKKSVTQKSLLSQSLPVSTFSDLYRDPSIRDENSLYASSNPSSRRPSETSSLDDVCFPVDSLDEIERSQKWPNIALLNEFAQEEIEEQKKIRSGSISRSSMTPSRNDDNNNDDNVKFQYPIVSNIDYGEITEPLLVSKNEEIDPINGRLRPKKMTPWNKPEFITRHDKSADFRFTYFRPDIPETLHSPTISGLLHGGRTFEDIFSPQKYGVTTSENNLSDNKLHKATTNPGLSTYPPNSTTPTSSNTHVSKPLVQPFWLDVLNPTDEEMKTISKTFGIHPLTSEDIFLGEAREKVELFKDYYFVCFTSFDVEEEHQRRKKAAEKAFAEAIIEEHQKAKNDRSMFEKLVDTLRRRASNSSGASMHSSSSRRSRKSADNKKRNTSILSRKTGRKKYNKDELIPLTMYIVVFRDGVITFHFKPTPHTGNVRRRVRLLRDYLTVTSDWIGYALIDDITDAFAPLIEAIETEVNSIEDEIISMQSGDHSDSDSDSDSDDENDSDNPVWMKLKRRNSNVLADKNSIYSKSTISTNSSSEDTKIISWKKKGDMLKRIGDCRRRVMSMLRLLGSKADVIKGFSKRYNEQWEVTPRTEIGLYLGDIQDHIVTMVQNLNHYEKLLARSHSNYLAQINIDMTKVNNDMNDILGKITILGTIVLPLNIITGLWGMNCIVPGQDRDDLVWFWSILTGMIIFSLTCYFYVKKLMNLV